MVTPPNKTTVHFITSKTAVMILKDIKPISFFYLVIVGHKQCSVVGKFRAVAELLVATGGFTNGTNICMACR